MSTWNYSWDCLTSLLAPACDSAPTVRAHDPGNKREWARIPFLPAMALVLCGCLSSPLWQDLCFQLSVLGLGLCGPSGDSQHLEMPLKWFLPGAQAAVEGTLLLRPTALGSAMTLAAFDFRKATWPPTCLLRSWDDGLAYRAPGTGVSGSLSFTPRRRKGDSIQMAQQGLL